MNAIGNKIYVMDPIFGRGAAVARIPKMRKERGEREREEGIANIPVDGFTIAIICQKIYRRASSWIFPSFFPTKVWGRPLETHARVCSSRDTVTTYKGLG